MNTGLHEASNVALFLFPNPTQGRLTIQSNQALLNKEYSVFNAMGSIVKRGTIVQLNQSIDLTGLPDGQYLLKSEGAVAVSFQLIR